MDNEKYGIDLSVDYKKAVSGIEKVEQTLDNVTTSAEETANRFEKLFANMSLNQLENELNKVDVRIQKAVGNLEPYQEKMRNLSEIYSEALNRYGTPEASHQEEERIQSRIDDINREYEKEINIYETLTQKQEILKQLIEEATKEQEKFGNVTAKAIGDGSSAIGILNNKFTKITSVTNNFGKNFGKTMVNGIKNIKKFALSLFGIQTGWRAITRAMNAYKSVDKDISQKVQSAWIGLGSFMAPVLEKMADLVIKLVAYLNKLIKYLTGVDLLSRAIAKSSSKASSSMNKVLASIDQITNLDSGGGLADDWTTPFKNLGDIDITPITKFVDRAKELIMTIFDPIQKAWENKGPGLIKSMKYAFDEVKTLAGHIFDDMIKVWTNGTGKKIMEKLIEGWTTIFNIIGNVTGAIDNAWKHHDNGYKIIQNLSDLYYYILDLVNEIGKTIEEWTLSEEFQQMLNEISDLFELITRKASDLGKEIRDFYKKYVKEPMTKILKILSLVITIFALLGEIGLKAGDKIFKKWRDDLKPVVDKLYESLNYVLTVLKDILQFVVDVLQKDWKKAWKDMKKTVEDLFDPLEKVKKYFSDMKGMSFGEKTLKISGDFTGLTNAWNTARRSLVGGSGGFGVNIGTSVGSALGDWISSKIWGYDVGTNYVPYDQLAMVHKGEAIVPKEFNSKEFFGNAGNQEVISAIKDLEQTLINKDMNAYISKNDVGKASVSYINEQARLIGRSVI